MGSGGREDQGTEEKIPCKESCSLAAGIIDELKQGWYNLHHPLRTFLCALKSFFFFRREGASKSGPEAEVLCLYLHVLTSSSGV